MLGLRPLVPKEIDGLLVHPGKGYTLLTDHLITGYPLRSEPAQEEWFVKFIGIRLLWLSWKVIFEALVGCHDILILGKSPIKWRQCPNMTIAVDWSDKLQSKQIYGVPSCYKSQLVPQGSTTVQVCIIPTSCMSSSLKKNSMFLLKYLNTTIWLNGPASLSFCRLRKLRSLTMQWSYYAGEMPRVIKFVPCVFKPK